MEEEEVTIKEYFHMNGAAVDIESLTDSEGKFIMDAVEEADELRRKHPNSDAAAYYWAYRFSDAYGQDVTTYELFSSLI